MPLPDWGKAKLKDFSQAGQAKGIIANTQARAGTVEIWPEYIRRGSGIEVGTWLKIKAKQGKPPMCAERKRTKSWKLARLMGIYFN
jgi:hypothetical protein